MKNHFSDCDDIASVVFQAIGGGSVCWESMEGTGIFDDVHAKRLGDDAVARINELLAVQR